MQMSNPDNNLRTLAELLTIEFQALYLSWGKQQEPRTGLHASALLVKDEDWCVRQHVLARLYPDKLQQEELHNWDWKRLAVFLDGWERHRKIQKLLRDHSDMVVITDREFETDLTHYDDTREVYFSPDAIISWGGQRFIVEIKGLDTTKFQALTDSLETAIQVSDVVAKARIQCNLYMHLESVKLGILLIEDKNTQAFKLWVIEYDAALSKPYVERLYAVKGSATLTRTFGLAKLPKRVCNSRHDKLAKSCPVRDLCFSKEMEV